MTTSPERALVRLVLVALAILGLPVTIGLGLAGFGVGPVNSGARAVFCLFVPASSLDATVHAAALGAFAAASLALFTAARTLSRERTTQAELRRATAAARLVPVPSRVDHAATQLGIGERVDVVPADRPFAFVHGWLRPRICLSTGMINRLSERELRAALLHERWHLNRRDPARLLLVRSIDAAFGFVPPVRDLVDQCLLAIEIDADRHVVREMGHPRWLAAALVKTLAPPLATPAFEGLADARIAALAGEAGRHPARRGFGRAALAALIVKAVVLTSLLGEGRLATIVGYGFHTVC